MEESAIYENLGRKQTDLDNLNSEYDRLLGVLGLVVAGEVARERVSVDYASRTWAVEGRPLESTPE